MGGIVAGIPRWLVTGLAVGKLEEWHGRSALQQPRVRALPVPACRSRLGS